MALAAEFMILSVQIHQGQGYHSGGVHLTLPGLFYSHLGYGGLVGPDDAAALTYRHRFWKSR